jgi:hypothetical protein
VGDVVVVGGEEALDRLREDPEVANLHKKSHTVTGTEIVTQEGEKIGEVLHSVAEEFCACFRGRRVAFVHRVAEKVGLVGHGQPAFLLRSSSLTFLYF